MSNRYLKVFQHKETKEKVATIAVTRLADGDEIWLAEEHRPTDRTWARVSDVKYAWGVVSYTITFANGESLKRSAEVRAGKVFIVRIPAD